MSGIWAGRRAGSNQLAKVVANSISDLVEIRNMEKELDWMEKELARMEKDNSKLWAEVKELEMEVVRKIQELTSFQDKCIEAARCVERIWGTFDYSGDIHKKARLYDEEKRAVSGTGFFGQLDVDVRQTRHSPTGVRRLRKAV